MELETFEILRDAVEIRKRIEEALINRQREVMEKDKPENGMIQDTLWRELGLFFFCFAVTNAIAQLVFGRLADRIGHGTPMVLSGFVTAVGLFFAIIATSTLQFYIVAVFLGLGGAMALPSTAAVAAGAAPPTERGRVMGLLSMSGSLGRATGPIIGGFLYASIIALTDNPFLAALPPVTIALIVGILGSLAAIPLFLRARSRSTNAKTGEEKPLKIDEG